MVKKLSYKMIFTLIAVIVLLMSTNMVCYAYDSTDTYENYMQSSGADSLMDNVPSEAKNVLDDLGIEDISFESIYNVSFGTIIKNILNMISDKTENPLKSVACIFGIVILISVSKLFQSSKEIESVLNFAASLVSAAAIIIPLSQSLSSVVSAIKLSSNFMISFVPVFVALVSVSGNPMLAVTYNSLAIGMVEGIAQISEKILTPFTNMVISLNLVSSVTGDVHIDKASQFIKKISITVMTFFATIFTGFLSIKGILANSADTVSAKGIKFIAGNLIPVIGSSIGDAYSSIAGSLRLLKSAVGIFGIIVVVIINFPIIAETCIWLLALHICGMITDLFGEKSLSILINGTLKALQIVLAILIFNLFIMTVSTGIILSIKADL